MTVRIRTITFDCSDPYLLAGFWSKLTGYGEDPTNTNHPDDPEGLLVAPDGSANLLFIHVPEGKREVQQPMLTRAYASLAAGKRANASAWLSALRGTQ